MKVIFLCHGNICRSPMAEYIFKYLVEKNNVSHLFEISSRATSSEEYMNDIYPPAKNVLRKNSIPFSIHHARKITIDEYNEANYVLAMEEYNISNLKSHNILHKFHQIPNQTFRYTMDQRYLI